MILIVLSICDVNNTWQLHWSRYYDVFFVYIYYVKVALLTVGGDRSSFMCFLQQTLRIHSKRLLNREPMLMYDRHFILEFVVEAAGAGVDFH